MAFAEPVASSNMPDPLGDGTRSTPLANSGRCVSASSCTPAFPLNCPAPFAPEGAEASLGAPDVSPFALVTNLAFRASGPSDHGDTPRAGSQPTAESPGAAGLSARSSSAVCSVAADATASGSCCSSVPAWSQLSSNGPLPSLPAAMSTSAAPSPASASASSVPGFDRLRTRSNLSYLAGEGEGEGDEGQAGIAASRFRASVDSPSFCEGSYALRALLPPTPASAEGMTATHSGDIQAGSGSACDEDSGGCNSASEAGAGQAPGPGRRRTIGGRVANAVQFFMGAAWAPNAPMHDAACAEEKGSPTCTPRSRQASGKLVAPMWAAPYVPPVVPATSPAAAAAAAATGSDDGSQPGAEPASPAGGRSFGPRWAPATPPPLPLPPPAPATPSLAHPHLLRPFTSAGGAAGEAPRAADAPGAGAADADAAQQPEPLPLACSPPSEESGMDSAAALTAPSLGLSPSGGSTSVRRALSRQLSSEPGAAAARCSSSRLSRVVSAAEVLDAATAAAEATSPRVVSLSVTERIEEFGELSEAPAAKEELGVAAEATEGAPAAAAPAEPALSSEGAWVAATPQAVPEVPSELGGCEEPHVAARVTEEARADAAAQQEPCVEEVGAAAHEQDLSEAEAAVAALQQAAPVQTSEHAAEPEAAAREAAAGHTVPANANAGADTAAAPRAATTAQQVAAEAAVSGELESAAGAVAAGAGSGTGVRPQGPGRPQPVARAQPTGSQPQPRTPLPVGRAEPARPPSRLRSVSAGGASLVRAPPAATAAPAPVSTSAGGAGFAHVASRYRRPAAASSRPAGAAPVLYHHSPDQGPGTTLKARAAAAQPTALAAAAEASLALSRRRQARQAALSCGGAPLPGYLRPTAAFVAKSAASASRLTYSPPLAPE